MSINRAQEFCNHDLKSPNVILQVLNYIFAYTYRNFPKRIILFLISKILEFVFQLVTVGLFAVTIQLRFSSDGNSQNLPFQKLLTHPILEQFLNFPTSAIFMFLAVIVFLNVIFAFVCRRILTRIAVDVEYNLSADILKSAKDIRYTDYKALNRVFNNFQKVNLLRFVQQNTRLVGIVARNLISALFSLLQFFILFVLFWFLGYKIAPILLLCTIIIAGLSLIWLFRIGITHSLNFPVSAAAAGKVRSQMLGKTLSCGYHDQSQIQKDYFNNAKINKAIKDYEDRFRIIDIGSLIINIITSSALLILIISFFSSGNVLNTTLLVIILFAGNIILRAVQQLSSFFVIIGRVYSQVWEVWAYQSVTSQRDSVSVSSIEANDFISFTDDKDLEYHLRLQAGDMLAICLHEEIGKMALFKIMSQKTDISNISGPMFEKMVVAEKEFTEEYILGLSRETVSSLRNDFKKIIKDMSDQDIYDKEIAFTIFVRLSLSEGIVFIPMAYLKRLNSKILEKLRNSTKPQLIVIYGRSPDKILRQYDEIIQSVILIGNELRIMKTPECLKLTGESLRNILSVKHAVIETNDNTLDSLSNF